MSIVACGAAGASAVVSGGVAVPLAIWACGSVVLNGIAKLEEPIKKGSCDGGSTGTCPIGGEGSCLQHLNNANSVLQDVQSCAVPPNVSACSTAIGLRLVGGGVKSLLDPEKVCSAPNQNKCSPMEEICNRYDGIFWDFSRANECQCDVYYQEKRETEFKSECLALNNAKWGKVGVLFWCKHFLK